MALQQLAYGYAGPEVLGLSWRAIRIAKTETDMTKQVSDIGVMIRAAVTEGKAERDAKKQDERGTGLGGPTARSNMDWSM